METTRRSWVKAVLWNVLGLLTMSAVGLAMTGSAVVGGAMAAINTAIGFTLYILYERIWARIGWGRHG
ncbi:DUF2061 domain-containing protein [Aliiroseovarius sp.]|uniref:DUF2061 domain-containing protein n=1 Tax=Aliiroseovarius sp. TaxID=1872442 RepID=UPI00262C1FD3|nr:DUF2061 domain-containing protein [Aliiroseovarius sp.]